jgi:hypothetical protein
LRAVQVEIALNLKESGEEEGEVESRVWMTGSPGLPMHLPQILQQPTNSLFYVPIREN